MRSLLCFLMCAAAATAACGSDASTTGSPLATITPPAEAPGASGTALTSPSGVAIPTVDTSQLQFTVDDGLHLPVPKAWLQDSTAPLLAESGKPATQWQPAATTTGMTYEDVLVSANSKYMQGNYYGVSEGLGGQSPQLTTRSRTAITIAGIAGCLRVDEDDGATNHETSLLIQRGADVVILRLRQGSEGDDPGLANKLAASITAS